MNNQIVANTKSIQFTEYGLEIEESTTADEWLDAVKKLTKADRMIQFYIGDLAVFAEWKWGDKYTQLMELTGYSNDVLRHFASIARRFSPHLREVICVVNNTNKKEVSFQAFWEVASLSDEKAIHLLRGFADGGIKNIADLRDAVRRERNGGFLPEPIEIDQHVACPRCGERFIP